MGGVVFVDVLVPELACIVVGDVFGDHGLASVEGEAFEGVLADGVVDVDILRPGLVVVVIQMGHKQAVIIIGGHTVVEPSQIIIAFNILLPGLVVQAVEMGGDAGAIIIEGIAIIQQATNVGFIVVGPRLARGVDMRGVVIAIAIKGDAVVKHVGCVEAGNIA